MFGPVAVGVVVAGAEETDCVLLQPPWLVWLKISSSRTASGCAWEMVSVD